MLVRTSTKIKNKSWPNGWTDQDETWQAGRPRPCPHCVKWGLPLPKGAYPPIFGPYLLWSNGLMDQDATWYGSRPLSKRHCDRWGHSSPFPKRGRAPQFSVHVYCGQTAGWIKMPLGMEAGLGPGPLPKNGAQPPNFWPMPIVPKRLDESRCHLLLK